MASLREAVKNNQEELRDGIACVVFWREDCSWNSENFHLEMDDTFYPEDKARFTEIQAIDPNAVVLNSYYCGYLDESMSLNEMAAGIHHHYENGLNNIAPFMNKTHFMVEISPHFDALASTKDNDRLFAMLPYKSLCFTGMKGRHGVYAMINRDKRRDVSIRRPRPPIRKQLSDNKQDASPKNAAARTQKNELEI